MQKIIFKEKKFFYQLCNNFVFKFILYFVLAIYIYTFFKKFSFIFEIIMFYLIRVKERKKKV
jgi:hypothetical protein